MTIDSEWCNGNGLQQLGQSGRSVIKSAVPGFARRTTKDFRVVCVLVKIRTRHTPSGGHEPCRMYQIARALESEVVMKTAVIGVKVKV